ncbi:MAG: dihydrofolate reductase [Clostridiaceae bacterium]
MLSYVVVISQNNVIGYKGKIPWRLPDDVKFFKEITLTGTKTMIMGRKTFESLPRVLPGRKHIVYTENKEYHVDDKNVEIIHNLDELLAYASSDLEYFVIGGAQIFKLLFPYTDRIYLTKIHADFEGDTFFPEYDELDWEVTDQRVGVVDEKNRYSHTFYVLNRKKQK